MKIEIVQKINEEYYREFYSEWLQCRSKYKKWQLPIGYIGFAASLIVFLVDSSLAVVSIWFLVFGIIMMYSFYASKAKWLKQRRKSKMTNQEVTMLFEEDQFQSTGPFTKVDGKWSFFSDVVETNKGLFLIPENGVSIYLQKKSFEHPADIAEIIRKIKAA